MYECCHSAVSDFRNTQINNHLWSLLGGSRSRGVHRLGTYIVGSYSRLYYTACVVLLCHQRAIEESKKQLQLEERRRRVHRRDLLSDSMEHVSPSAMSKLGRQHMKGCGSREMTTETISTQKEHVGNSVTVRGGGEGGAEGWEEEKIEECEQEDPSSVADICIADAEPGPSKVVTGDGLPGENSVLGNGGGESPSPSVLNNTLGVPVRITSSTFPPYGRQPPQAEEQQQQGHLLEGCGADEAECDTSEDQFSMCTTVEKRVPEVEVEMKEDPDHHEATLDMLER